mmetsp:Transcript_10828/g.15624  ORF Transcript_10828/g.15624 Transcript_10828/m.15624 type:complete len:84 (-) Transcript_10828:185-436(-)
MFVRVLTLLRRQHLCISTPRNKTPFKLIPRAKSSREWLGFLLYIIGRLPADLELPPCEAENPGEARNRIGWMKKDCFTESTIT